MLLKFDSQIYRNLRISQILLAELFVVSMSDKI